MGWDIAVGLEHRASLAQVGEALADAGLNIGGGTIVLCDGRATVHLLVDDPDAATAALNNVGIEVGRTRAVVSLKIEDRVGALGEMARKLFDAAVSLDLMYLATDGSLILGVDDMEAAREAVAE